MKKLTYGLYAASVLATAFLVFSIVIIGKPTPEMFWPTLGSFAILMALMIVEIINSFRAGAKQQKEAVQLGYDTMKRLLVEPYCGPDKGYEPELVARAQFSWMERFSKSSEVEQRACMKGMREALTEYEREHGAP
jgi:hypothetical protein